MISLLKGHPQIIDQELVLWVNGVGYDVNVSQKVLTSITQNTETTFYIHTHVKEDKFELYGFLTYQEKQLFKLVLSVAGIGPTTALYIVNKDPQQLIAAVQEANVSFFKAIPRIGKKVAQKIIIDLRGKLGELKELNLEPLSPKQQTVADALLALGWDETSIVQSLEGLDLQQLSEQAAIKAALKKMRLK